MNWIAILVSALIPMAVGFIWYHPRVFGTIWMKSSGMTKEKMKGGNMPLIFGLSFVFAFLIAVSLQPIVIHQFGAAGLIGGNIKDAPELARNFFAEYKCAFRTFKHGCLHGALTSIFLLFPIFATDGLFEHKKWAYILVKAGYWLVSLTLMGGILSVWVK